MNNQQIEFLVIRTLVLKVNITDANKNYLLLRVP